MKLCVAPLLQFLRLEHHCDWMHGLQVHNALGFAYFNMDRSELALKNYRRAVELQPGYTTAWNNLGDAYEKARDWDQVLPARDSVCLTSTPLKLILGLMRR